MEETMRNDAIAAIVDAVRDEETTIFLPPGIFDPLPELPTKKLTREQIFVLAGGKLPPITNEDS